MEWEGEERDQTGIWISQLGRIEQVERGAIETRRGLAGSTVPSWG